MKTWDFDVDHSFEINNFGDSIEIGSRLVSDELAEKLRLFLADDPIEVIVTFRCSGSSLPGNYYGPPEECYPDEFDEERIIECVCIGEHSFLKEDPLFKELENCLIDLIDEVEVDYGFYVD